jgi:hypothetical protein
LICSQIRVRRRAALTVLTPLNGAWCCFRPRVRLPITGELLPSYAGCTGIRSTDLFGIAEYSPEDAQDLTQGFFLHLIERKTLRRVDRAKGKFRSFLLASLQNYLSTDVYGDEEKYFGKVPGKRGFSVRFEPVVYRADDTVSIVRTTMRPVQSSTRPGSVTSCRKMAASIFGPSPSACSAICRPQFTGATFLLTRAGATQIRGPICYPMPSGKRHARSSAAGEILPQSF